MTILVATDYSALARQAATLAAEIARARGEQLAVLHLVDGPILASDRALLVEEEQRLMTVGVQAPLRVRALLEQGKVTGPRFADIVQATQASLVVVGAHGTGAAIGLGSVAQKIVRHVMEPLLVVRQPERLLRLDAHRSVRALVALALDRTDAGLTGAVRAFAKARALEAELVHYRELPEPASPQRSNQDLATATRRAFGEGGENVRLRDVHVRDGFGRLDVHLTELAKALDVDLLAVGSHHRAGMDRIREGSVSEGVVSRAPVSVLVGGASS